MSDEKYREFWIFNRNGEAFVYEYEIERDNLFHVIEYKAYADLKKENERLNNYTILGYETMLAELKAENERLRKVVELASDKDGYFDAKNHKVYDIIIAARQALEK